MLVLQRKKGEEIVISDSIRIRVLSVRGNHVRLGLAAPDDVLILRQECVSRAGPADGAAPASRPASPG